jgi:Ran GTPase-activating protein (RanGAP) involved in mRNA processing and transport
MVYLCLSTLIERMKMKYKISEILNSGDIDALKAALAGVKKLDLNSFIGFFNISSLLTEKSVLLLAESLKSNNSLTHLFLQGNDMGDTGGSAIGEVLKSNNSLTMVDLKWNQLGDSGAAAIAEALKINNSLLALNLSNNKIEDSGGASIGEALKINNSLTALDLKWNKIGDSGGASIGEALKINTSLTQLDLGENKIRASRVEDICRAITRNKNLAEDKAELGKIQELLLVAIQNDDIVESCKLLHQYQHLISYSAVPNLLLQVKDDKIDSYISKNYFQLMGVCKNVDNGLWHWLPLDIKTEVLSYLWPHILSPQLFSKTEETDILGNICLDDEMILR